jgi:hypothetical protein
MQRSSYAHKETASPSLPTPKPPQCCPSPTRIDHPRTFGYPCCGRGRFAGCRRRSERRLRGSANSLACEQPNRHSNTHISAKLELVLLCRGGDDLDAGPHVYSSHDLLANEVSDLNFVVALAILVDVHVDGETGGMLACVILPGMMLRSALAPNDHVTKAGTAV